MGPSLPKKRLRMTWEGSANIETMKATSQSPTPAVRMNSESVETSSIPSAASVHPSGLFCNTAAR